MAGCCSGRGYDEFFTEKVALRDSRRYRRKGLDPAGRRIVGFAARSGISGATVVDVGAGVGSLGLELLKAGAERVVSTELSTGYDEAAAQLARDAGVSDRVERRIADVEQAPELPAADVVVMHRVVCCYPDHESLVASAARSAGRFLAFSYPRSTWWTRAGAVAANLFLRARRCCYRTYVHPPSALIADAEQEGLRLAYEHEGLLWRIAGFERS